MAWSNRLRNAHRAAAAHAGQLVTISRGALRSAPIRALWGNARYEIIEHDGKANAVTAQDWLILAEDYRFDAPTAPRPGDRIETAAPKMTYEVLSLTPTTQATETAGHPTEIGGQMLRVHTKRIA